MFQIASVARMPQANVDSEMEEGEIVDDLDDLSDISSEEEFLLRQRLEVLEDYNNVLERSKKKRSTGLSGINRIKDLQSDLSEISTAEIDTQINGTNHALKVSRSIKHCSKPKRRKELVYKTDNGAYVKRKREYRKKPNHAKRKPVKVVNESSDESEDEYRNKRKKLADAVKVHKSKTDSSLSARLKKMLHRPKECSSTVNDLLNLHDSNNYQNEVQLKLSPVRLEGSDVVDCGKIKSSIPKDSDKSEMKCNAIELSSSDDDVKVITEEQPPIQTDNISVPKTRDKDSDEDLDFLRQQVLSTKSLKSKLQVEPEIKIPSDDEDSDTAELRLICLKSTIIKRAMEIKQKQKRNRRLSQSQTTLDEDIFNDSIFFSKIDSDNNTDIETMDMDMESEAEEKKENKDESRPKKIDDRLQENNHTHAIPRTSKQDELEEDEDLLRAKLLTSLSKNLPNLVNPEILNTIQNVKSTKRTETKKANIPEKRFIIKLGGSDSEGEHEATKNLTKMHMKLSESTDFQQQLDFFLKSTRMQVENSKLPDVIKKQPTPKKPEKFVAKTVNSLPKPEQIEYKNLVRRMAELEKLKQLREAQLNSVTLPFKDKNTIVDTKFEEKISISRKRIADESAKMLKLKEEASKLSQRYKIVATELHNVSTAITLNKKQQRAVQNCLTKIRQQHQSLIKSSSTSLHSNVNRLYNNFTTKVATTAKVQKENNPKDEYKNSAAQKTVKISVVNDLKNDINTKQISVHLTIANNKKVVKIPNPVKERLVEISETTGKESLIQDRLETMDSLVKESCENTCPGENRVGDSKYEEIKDESKQGHAADDYKSPLDAFGDTSWESDPNAILCPYDVGGQCKDPDCKYLHTQTSEQ